MEVHGLGRRLANTRLIFCLYFSKFVIVRLIHMYVQWFQKCQFQIITQGRMIIPCHQYCLHVIIIIQDVPDLRWMFLVYDLHIIIVLCKLFLDLHVHNAKNVCVFRQHGEQRKRNFSIIISALIIILKSVKILSKNS